MSWNVIEQFKTGEVECMIATHPGIIGAGETDPIDVRGYTKGTVTIEAVATTSDTIILQGSNSGTSFFDISPTITHSTNTQILTWSVPVKEVKISTTATIDPIFLMVTAGENGGSSGSGGGGSSYCAGSNTEVIHNEGGFCAGDPGLTFINNAGTAADPKFLNIGTTTAIGGLKRRSNPVANSWEDGHLGNSTKLIFTPSDFTVTDPTHGFGVDSSQNNPSIPNSRGLGLETSAAKSIVVAQKVLPKGFKLTESTITIFTLTNIIGNALRVTGQSWNQTGAVTDGYSGGSGFASNTVHTLDLFTDINFVGDGNNMVTVIWVPGVLLTIANCITGMEITMSRI